MTPSSSVASALPAPVVPAAVSSTASSAASAATPGPWPCFKRLTAEEMATKWVNSECYFCTEKFVPGHKCGGKGIFLLEMDDGTEVDH